VNKDEYNDALLYNVSLFCCRQTYRTTWLRLQNIWQRIRRR